MKSRFSFLMALVGGWALGLTASAEAETELKLYGYFTTNWEKVLNEPSLENGQIVEESSPAEFSFPFFNLMAQQQLDDHFRIFINLNGANSDQIEVRNFWGEYTLDQRFRLRIGKMYRKFGLYNELLDAVPVYFGIEPPELFDKDHLIVSRTTIFMVHGSLDLGAEGSLEYAFTTDNGEGGSSSGGFPLGWDLKYKIGTDYVLGTSGYTSGGHTTSDVKMGEGSPRSGVLPWMERDEFSVWGTYGEAQFFDQFMLQGAFWRAAHRGRRDPEVVLAIIGQTELMPRQLGRFLLDPAGAVDAANVRRRAKYNITTWYIRTGYSFDTSFGELALYGQWDLYKNPETIKHKSYGGDNEAGASDDGTFKKTTAGIVFRPVPQVAAKLDQSFHFFKLNGQEVNYPEIRLDVSFTFGL